MNLGPLFQSIGQIGKVDPRLFLEAKKLQMQEIFDKLGIKREQTEEAEREERLRRLKLQPDTEEAKIQQQIDSAIKVAKHYGIDVKPEDVRSMLGFQRVPENVKGIQGRLEEGLAALPEAQRKVVEPAIRSYMEAGEYDKAMQVYSAVAEKFQAEPGTPEVLSEGGIPFGLKIGKKLLTPKSPEWTPEHQAIIDAGTKAALEADKRKNDMEEKRERASMARLLKTLSAREMQDFFNDYDKAHKSLVPLDRLAGLGTKAKVYVDTPTGPGDVALLSAYVEATKPERGFRWTQQEVNLISQSRGWLEGAQARMEKGYKGTLFGPPGSEQRKVIGNIISRASNMANEDRQKYLNGIKTIKPELYKLLTDDLGSDFKQD